MREDAEVKEIRDKFIEAMDDDFNTALAVSYLYELVKLVNKTDDANKLANVVNFFEEVVEPVLGISFVEEKSNGEEVLDDKLINFIISLRKQARDEKRYDLSDQIRDNLSEMGITLKDSREGTTYEK